MPIKPEYLVWKKRVEGQIKHMMFEHPEYFTFKDERAKQRCIGGMAKRIIGEIVAGMNSGNNTPKHGNLTMFERLKKLCKGTSAVSGKNGASGYVPFLSKEQNHIQQELADINSKPIKRYNDALPTFEKTQGGL